MRSLPSSNYKIALCKNDCITNKKPYQCLYSAIEKEISHCNALEHLESSVLGLVWGKQRNKQKNFKRFFFFFCTGESGANSRGGGGEREGEAGGLAPQILANN